MRRSRGGSLEINYCCEHPPLHLIFDLTIYKIMDFFLKKEPVMKPKLAIASPASLAGVEPDQQGRHKCRVEDSEPSDFVSEMVMMEG